MLTRILALVIAATILLAPISSAADTSVGNGGGTQAITAGSNVTVGGTRAHPTVGVVSSPVFTGNVTSNGATINGSLTVGVNSLIGTPGTSAIDAFDIGNPSTATGATHRTRIITGGGAFCSSISSELLAIGDGGVGWDLCLSQAGSLGVIGDVAAQAFTSNAGYQINGVNVILNSSGYTYLYAPSAGFLFHNDSAPNADIASMPAAGGFNLAAGSFTAGGSVYGANAETAGNMAIGGTSQSANAGDLTITRSGYNSGYIFYGTSATHYSGFDGTNFLFNGANTAFSNNVTANSFLSGTNGTASGGSSRLEWGTSTANCADGFGSIFASTGAVNGVPDNLAFIGCGIAGRGIALDNNGNAGIYGDVYANNFRSGSSYISATAAHVNGSVFSVGGNLQVSQNGTTNAEGTVGNFVAETIGGPIEVLGCVGNVTCPIYLYSHGTGSTQTVQIDGNGGITLVGAGTIDNAGSVLRFHNASAGSMQFVNSAVSVVNLSLDDGGNAVFHGNVTAANFYNGSRREWKTDIHSIDDLDPFRILPKHWYTYRYRSSHGGHPNDPLKAGYMANDTNVLLAGPNHDRYDLGNTLAITALATIDLNKRVKALESRTRLGGNIQINGTTHDPRVDELEVQVRLLWVTLLGMMIVLAGVLVKVSRRDG